MRNPYQILEVSEKASYDEIKKAYRCLSRKYHPDNIETGDEEKFKEISAAYDLISDPVQREQIDQTLHQEGTKEPKFYDFKGSDTKKDQDFSSQSETREQENASQESKSDFNGKQKHTNSRNSLNHFIYLYFSQWRRNQNWRYDVEDYKSLSNRFQKEMHVSEFIVECLEKNISFTDYSQFERAFTAFSNSFEDTDSQRNKSEKNINPSFTKSRHSYSQQNSRRATPIKKSRSSSFSFKNTLPSFRWQISFIALLILLLFLYLHKQNADYAILNDYSFTSELDTEMDSIVLHRLILANAVDSISEIAQSYGVNDQDISVCHSLADEPEIPLIIRYTVPIEEVNQYSYFISMDSDLSIDQIAYQYGTDLDTLRALNPNSFGSTTYLRIPNFQAFDQKQKVYTRVF